MMWGRGKAGDADEIELRGALALRFDRVDLRALGALSSATADSTNPQPVCRLDERHSGLLWPDRFKDVQAV